MTTSAPSRLHGSSAVAPAAALRASHGELPAAQPQVRAARLALPGVPEWVAPRLAGSAAMLVLLAGAAGLLSGTVPVDATRLRAVAQVLGLPGASTAAAGSVVLGVSLMVLARGLRRRQRRAWALSVPLLVAAMGLHLGTSRDADAAAQGPRRRCC